MDKLLEQFGTTILKLEEFIVAKAPQVYGVIKAQVLLESKVELIIGLSLYGICGLTILFGAIVTRKDRNLGPLMMGLVVAFVLAIFATLFYVGGYMGLHNPDYFAIKDLLHMATSK